MARILVVPLIEVESMVEGSKLTLILIGMFVLSISIISLLIFSCADDGSGKPRKSGGYAAAQPDGGGGHGGGGGYDGHGGADGGGC